jgi:hypothetical protein
VNFSHIPKFKILGRDSGAMTFKQFSRQYSHAIWLSLRYILLDWFQRQPISLALQSIPTQVRSVPPTSRDMVGWAASNITIRMGFQPSLTGPIGSDMARYDWSMMHSQGPVNATSDNHFYRLSSNKSKKNSKNSNFISPSTYKYPHGWSSFHTYINSFTLSSYTLCLLRAQHQEVRVPMEEAKI